MKISVHVKNQMGILGCGRIASKFAADLKLVNDAELVAVASRSMKNAQEFTAQFPAVIFMILIPGWLQILGWHHLCSHATFTSPWTYHALPKQSKRYYVRKPLPSMRNSPAKWYGKPGSGRYSWWRLYGQNSCLIIPGSGKWSPTVTLVISGRIGQFGFKPAEPVQSGFSIRPWRRKLAGHRHLQCFHGTFIFREAWWN